MATEALGAVLSQLEALADGADRASLLALRDRLDASRLRVLVAGEAKRGKSTLVNALLEREILPVGVTPLTAVATTVQEGADEAIEVTFADGHVSKFTLGDLADFGTERGNPGNRRGVESITVRVAAPVLAHGVELVDTPGTGSVHAHNTAAADAALPSMDAAIFVLTADPPVSASERALLKRVAGLSVRLFLVLNKVDYLDAVGLAEAIAFTEGVVSETIGRTEQLYPLSARSGSGPGGAEGLARFAADFAAYLETGRSGDLELSASAQAARLAAQMLDEVALAEHAARLPAEEAAERTEAFAARLNSVTDRRAEAEDRVEAQRKRLLSALNAAAEQVRPQISASATTEMTGELLAGDLRAAAPGDIELIGRSRLTGLVADAVNAWRHDQAAVLEAGLQGIDERLGAELETELAAVRAAAFDLLGLRLALPAPGQRLDSGLRFFYVLDEQVDQAELLAGAVRRRVPGELGRKIARQHVLDQIPDMVDAYVGRARGDLQYRLGEGARRLQAAVRSRFESSTERLSAALERAALIRASTASQGAQELAELSARAATLHAILAELSPPDGASASCGSGPGRRDSDSHVG